VFILWYVSSFSENGMSREETEASTTLYVNPARSYPMVYGVCENANLGNCRLQGWRRQKEQLSIQKLGRWQLSTSYFQVGEIDTILHKGIVQRDGSGEKGPLRKVFITERGAEIFRKFRSPPSWDSPAKF